MITSLLCPTIFVGQPGYTEIAVFSQPRSNAFDSCTNSTVYSLLPFRNFPSNSPCIPPRTHLLFFLVDEQVIPRRMLLRQDQYRLQEPHDQELLSKPKTSESGSGIVEQNRRRMIQGVVLYGAGVGSFWRTDLVSCETGGKTRQDSVGWDEKEKTPMYVMSAPPWLVSLHRSLDREQLQPSRAQATKSTWVLSKMKHDKPLTFDIQEWSLECFFESNQPGNRFIVKIQNI